MLERIIVAIIVAVAVMIAIRGVVRSVKGKERCNCGCENCHAKKSDDYCKKNR